MDDSKQCTATANRTGKRCTRARMPGATVCSKHGGSIGRVKEAAQRRADETNARELAARVAVDLAQFDGNPFAALRDLLAPRSGRTRTLRPAGDRLSDDQLVYMTRSGSEQIRAALTGPTGRRDSLGRQARLDAQGRAWHSG